MMVPGQGMVGVPAGRASADEVGRLHGQIAGDPLVANLLDAVPEILLILNEQRQVVFANQALADVVGIGDLSQVLGLRPGEALQCLHATESGGDCGNTRFCAACGALGAWDETRKSEAPAVRECRILRTRGEMLDLRVHARPLPLGARQLTALSLCDISGERRRHILERIFFHDVANTASGLAGAAELFSLVEPEQQEEIREMVGRMARRLVEEIRSQSEIACAEKGTLAARPTTNSALELAAETVEFYRHHPAAADRHIRLEPGDRDATVVCDPLLLGRVLGNMVRNALEACGEGETVTVGFGDTPDGMEFHVHNPAAMPDPVQLQVFQRGFTTRGPGRGMGTYSMRLIGEKFLGGKVGFSSDPAGGTTFFVRLPKVPPTRVHAAPMA